ncbi:hypothetical protein [Terasakiella sp. SH-1]|uniref:hypothetical protein n=1 Tax=Terasakiella sp. SH-1 TaxID=2560057 RepID=UPI0010746C45|nr:hypothetical protein [Terasakiella sp. SH-1]
MKHFTRAFVITALLLVAGTAQAFEFEKAKFEEIAKNTISAALSGKIDNVDAVMADQKKLIALGVAGCRAYAQEDATHKAMMELVASSAEKMTAMSLEQIEEAWHEGGALAEIGVDVDDIEHFGTAISLMDAVVHPATAYIALQEYKKTGEAELLVQVKDELSEVLEHMSHIH